MTDFKGAKQINLKSKSKRHKMAKKKKERFPKKELNTWLRSHSNWNHQDWADLIENLSVQSFHEWTDTEKGRNEIGFYLETKRR